MCFKYISLFVLENFTDRGYLGSRKIDGRITVKLIVKGGGCEDVNWIELARIFSSFVVTAMNLRVTGFFFDSLISDDSIPRNSLPCHSPRAVVFNRGYAYPQGYAKTS
jgi:hypothetical protein